MLDEDLRRHPLADAFLMHKRLGEDRALSTTKSYAEALAEFLKWSGCTTPDLIAAPSRLHLWVTLLRMTPVEGPGRAVGRPRAPNRINQMLAAVREFYKFAVHTEALPTSLLAVLWTVADDRDLPMELRHETGVGYRVSPRHRLRGQQANSPDGVTADDAGALLHAAQNWRDRFIVWTLWTTGLRVGALLGLRRSDLHFVDNASDLGCRLPGPHLHVEARENSNGARAKNAMYYVPVRDDLMALYEEYLIVRERRLGRNDVCDFVLVNLWREPIGAPMRYATVRQLFAALSARAGLDRAVTPHMMRHGTGEALVASGSDLSVVQAMLGHRSITSSEIYGRARMPALRDAVDKLPPLPGGLS